MAMITQNLDYVLSVGNVHFDSTISDLALNNEQYMVTGTD